ncbi:Ig-like domain-containing protein [Variovorax sp. J2P1-59]|uniref:Ig-like domain-containing protein n=1 Tax=Variovorax flavidus TaxID=3053501 RepID=UPI0025763FC3|nr:Ig-like domain-containing protein [Variovorax sp. J2P1-59]MDM0077513.1 Ig-like domain-containing protein [Variovorax sp. J2P1-59]
MSSKKTKVVINNGNGKNVVQDVAAHGQAPTKIKVQPKVKYLLKGDDDGFAPENVTATRVGNDLHIAIEGESNPGLILEGYFSESDVGGLFGVAEDGQLYSYVPTDGGEIFTLAEGEQLPMALGGESYGAGAPYLVAGGNDGGFGFLPLMLFGGLAGLGLYAATKDRSSGGFHLPVADKEEPPAKPGFPSLGGAIDDQGPTQGPIAPNGLTDDPQPEFFGVGTPGNIVTIYDKGNVVGSTVVDPGGEWRFTPEEKLIDGGHEITITEKKPGGPESPPSEPLEFVVDTEAPPKPDLGQVLKEVEDNVGTVKGPIEPNESTDDKQPEFKGVGTPGDLITIYEGDKPLGSAIVNEKGEWSVTPTEELPEGKHEVEITVTDPAGNESERSDKFPFEVDLTAPDAPDFKEVEDDKPAIIGPIESGESTNDKQPEFKGEGTPGDLITVYEGDKPLGSAVVNEQGKWSVIPEELPDGEHSVEVTATDPVGNESERSEPFEFTVDTKAPGAMDEDDLSLVDDFGDVTGPIAPDSLDGKGEPGNTITITDGETELGTAIVGGDGKWTFTVPEDKQLGSGEHTLTITETDQAGNVSEPLDVATFTVESTLVLNVTDTVVHEAALDGGTGKDWLTGGTADTSDLSAGGKFSLGDSVTSVKIELGGQATDITLAELKGGQPVTRQIGGDTLVVTSEGNGNYSYSYTLGGAKNHAVGSNTLNNDFKITATDAEGKSVSETAEIKIVDDEVTASPGSFEIVSTAAASGVGLTIVFDASNSMNAVDPGNTQSRWDLAKSALDNLLAKYEQSYRDDAKFEINLVLFDGLPQVAGAWPNGFMSQSFTSIADARAFLAAQDTGKGSATWYKEPLEEAQRLISKSLTAHPDYDQKVYFVTDGVPFANHTISNSTWGTFVNQNKDALDVYGVALGATVTGAAAETEIRKVLAPNDPGDLYFPVENPEDLAKVLESTLPVVEGNLFQSWDLHGKYQTAALGADKGFQLSKVMFDGVPYDFVDDSVTIAVQPGVTLKIEKDGTYFITGSDKLIDFDVPVTFDLMDKDGDVATVTETLHFVSPQSAAAASAAQASVTLPEADAAEDGGYLVTAPGEFEGLVFFDIQAGEQVNGGSGNDQFKIAATDFARLDGGDGIDTLVLDGNDMHVDLSALGSKVQHIEKFDLGAGHNTLALKAGDVLANGQADMVLADGKTQMVINGAEGEVDLLDGQAEGWSNHGATTVEGVTYNVYTNMAGTAELLVEDKVQVAIL